MENTPLVNSQSADVVQKSNVRNIVTANIIVCVLTCSTKIYEPVLAQYVYHQIADAVFGNDSRIKNYTVLAPCFDNTSDSAYQKVEKAQRLSSTLLWQFTLTGGLIAAVSNIFLGAYSDRIGRRFLFFSCITGQLLRNVLAAVIIWFHLDINLFFIGAFLDGLFGGIWGQMLVAYAYIADNTPPVQTRSFLIVLLECVIALSHASSSILAGYVIINTGFFYPTVIATAFVLLGFILVALFLRETVRDRDQAIRGCSFVFTVYHVFCTEGSSLKRGMLWAGLMSFLFTIIPDNAGGNVELLFLMNEPFCWSPAQYGLYDTISTVVRRTVGTGIARGLQVCFRDETISILGTVSVIAGDTIWSVAKSDVMLYVGFPCVGLIGFLAAPIARGAMSKLVVKSRHGSLFASLAVLEALSSALGGVVYNSIYKSTVDHWKGAFYVAMAATHVVAMVFFLVLKFLTVKRDREDLSIEHEGEGVLPPEPIKDEVCSKDTTPVN